MTTSSSLTNVEMRLWANLRLVVIDSETIQAPDGKNRIVDLAALSYRNGQLVHQWNRLINPRYPVDPHTVAIHGLTDEVLASQPVFDDIADEFLDILTPDNDTETVVIVVHHAAWDLGILHDELERTGRPMPSVPVLDTFGGLAGFLGIHPQRRSLAALSQTLSLPYAELHQAIADAKILGLVIVELLHRAAAAGHTDLNKILNTDKVGTTTDRFDVDPGHISRTFRPGGAAIPEHHFTTHGAALTETSQPADIVAWVTGAGDCAAYRCESLFDASDRAVTSPILYEELVKYGDQLISQAQISLDATAEEESPIDVAKPNPHVATVASFLGMAMPLITEHITAYPRAAAARAQVRSLYDRWGPTIRQLDRCHDDDRCVYCASGYSCPIDTWIYELGSAYAGPGRWSNNYYPAKEYDRKRSAGYHIYRAKPRDRAKYIELLDAAMSSVIDWHTSRDDFYNADRIARAAWEDGCRNPQVAARFAYQVASPGGTNHLTEGLNICNSVLQADDGSTARVWQDLHNVRDRIEGLLRTLKKQQIRQPQQTRNPRRHRRRFELTAPPPLPPGNEPPQ